MAEMVRELKMEPRGMSAVFLRIFRVLAVLVLLDLLFAFQFHPIRIRGFDVRTLEFWRAYSAPQVLVLGSSRPRENVDAFYLERRLEELGRHRRVFNLAFSGGGSFMINRQIERHIIPKWTRDPAGAPPLVLIDVGEFELHERFYNEQMEEGFRDIENWTGRFDHLRGFGFLKDTLRHGSGAYQKIWIAALTEPFLEMSGLYRFQGDWSKKEESRKRARKWALRILSLGKAAPEENLQPPPQAKEYLGDYAVGDTQTAKLAELIETVRRAGGIPVITSIPQAGWRKNFYAPGLEETFTSALSAFAAAHRVPLVTISNADAGLTDESYFDDVHLKREMRGAVTEAVLQKAVLPFLDAEAPRP